MQYKTHKNRFFRHLLVAPFIFSVIIPLVFTDIWIEVYHRVCFYLCGIPYVKRSVYIKIDRHKLSYLNFPQKLYCVYCGYANGVIAYWAKIAAETERYWCGIQHKADREFVPPSHHAEFAKYADEEEFRRMYPSS